MKKLIALVAAALVVIAASQLVSTVGATGKATIARRVAALEKKVKTLQAQVKVMRGDLACENAVIPISQYGSAAGPQGYLYTSDGTTVVPTTALDVAHAGQPIGAWVPVVDASCVSTAKASAFKPSHIAK